MSLSVMIAVLGSRRHRPGRERVLERVAGDGPVFPYESTQFVGLVRDVVESFGAGCHNLDLA